MNILNKSFSAVTIVGMLFASSTAFAAGDVSVSNRNTANVVNTAKVYADTGNNAANGDDAGEGGNGGNARGSRSSNEGGNGGDGGHGGHGGIITTGNAWASSNISNDVNTNKTEIVIEDCGCEGRYNETLDLETSRRDRDFSSDESRNKFDESVWKSGAEKERHMTHSEETEKTEYEKEGGKKGEEESKSYSHEEDTTKDSSSSEHMYDRTTSSDDQEKSVDEVTSKEAMSLHYTKTYVPEEGKNVRVSNRNSAGVGNFADVYSGTGENEADAGEGDDAGNGGNAKSDDNDRWWKRKGHHGMGSSENEGGNGGDGGNGGNGGDILTGHGEAHSDIANVVGRNINRVVRR